MGLAIHDLLRTWLVLLQEGVKKPLRTFLSPVRVAVALLLVHLSPGFCSRVPHGQSMHTLQSAT